MTEQNRGEAIFKGLMPKNEGHKSKVTRYIMQGGKEMIKH